MSDSWLRREVTVVNREGLHLRPADMFVRLASRYQSRVVVCRDSLRVDGKSILEIATLGAAQGTVLVIEVCGDDAEHALGALAELVQNGFHDGPPAADSADGRSSLGETPNP